MPTDAWKSDLRTVKTTKVLNAAMFTLLERTNFGKITVRDICEEAQISRATFYARFADKYDFLKKWMINLRPDGIDNINDYEQIEKIVNDSIYRNKVIITNLICDADNETLDILSGFALSIFYFTEKDSKIINPSQTVLSNFLAGGIIFYFQWQARQKFPPELAPMNIYLYEIIRMLKKQGADTI